MVILGIILMLISGIIFYVGEGDNCFLMIIEAIINFASVVCIISAFA